MRFQEYAKRHVARHFLRHTMKRQCTPVLLLAVASLVDAADPNVPHPHKGKVTKYTRGKPSQYGLRVRDAEAEAQLAAGKPIISSKDLKNDFRRHTAIFETAAPPDVVFGCITDLRRYPQMIGNIARTEIYSDKRKGVVRHVGACNRIRESAFVFDCYVNHEYNPFQRCMVFQLDYSRKSDVDDSSGYWFVEASPSGGSRVYYALEATVPAWVPKSLKGPMLSLGARRAASWVDEASTKAYSKMEKSYLRRARVAAKIAEAGAKAAAMKGGADLVRVATKAANKAERALAKAERGRMRAFARAAAAPRAAVAKAEQLKAEATAEAAEAKAIMAKMSARAKAAEKKAARASSRMFAWPGRQPKST